MKIICLGDSFTKGFGVKENESWFNLLASTSSHTFINKGINGDTTGGMLSRFHKDVVLENPNYVLITGGINDFICSAQPSMVQPNIMAIVHQAFSHGIIPIIGIEPQCIPVDIRTDWSKFTNFYNVYKKHKEYHDWLLLFTTTFGVDCIDFYTEFPRLAIATPLAEYYLDGLHLTSQGHKLIYNIANQYFK